MSQDEEPKRFARFKQHVKDNKKVYLAAAGGAVVGGTIVFLMRGDTQQVIKIKQFMGIGYKCSQTATTVILQAKGDPGDVVMRLSDKKTWPSKSEMARDLGIARALVSKYFAGDLSDLNGEQFEVLGKAGHKIIIPTT